MRSHRLRRIVSVVVTDYDPATKATVTSAHRVDMLDADRHTATRQRRLVDAIGALAELAAAVADIERRAAEALDAEHDGYPSSSGHLAVHGTAPSDPTADTGMQRAEDRRHEQLHVLRRAIDDAARAAYDAVAASLRVGRGA